MTGGRLIQQVMALIDEASRCLTGSVGHELASIRSALREPIRIAVAGRVKAGKSTLVNALLGQKVAPTDVSECTKVVTWFRYGHPQRVEIVARDGSRRDLPLDADGMLPRDVGIEPTAVASLQVWLSNEVLRSMTLIDTPGLGAVNEQISDATVELLTINRDSRQAVGTAQTLVFVLNQNVRADELEALRTFRTQGRALRGSAVNAIGVLTKADKVAVGAGMTDVWTAAVQTAERQADRFRQEVSTVCPVIGLLAETAEAAELTERDAAHLAMLAGFDARSRLKMLVSAERFIRFESAVPMSSRERLVSLLDLYGLERAFELIHSGTIGAGALRNQLSRLSGIQTLREVLSQTFRSREDALSARWGLNALESLTYQRNADESSKRVLIKLRADIEALRLSPGMHELDELDVLHSCSTGEVELPEALLEDLRRMTSGGELQGRLGSGSSLPADLLTAAREGATRWQRFKVTAATPSQAHVARVMVRSYELAWEYANQAGTTGRLA